MRRIVALPASAALLVLLVITMNEQASSAPQPEAGTASDSQAPGGQYNFSEMISNSHKQIKEALENLRSQFPNLDPESVQNAFKNQTTILAGQVRTYIESVTKEIEQKSPEFAKFWEDASAKLTKIAEDISANLPSANETISTMQTQFKDGLEAITKEVGTIAEQVRQNNSHLNDDFANIAKKTAELINMGVEATQSLKEQLMNADKQTQDSTAGEKKP